MAGRRDDLELVHQPARPREAEAQAVPARVAVLHREPDVGDPGPSSRAITDTPALPFCCTPSTTISPSRAYLRMFRASSEIAVAIMVMSEPPNPPCSATDRPALRAATTSESSRIGTQTSTTGAGGLEPPRPLEMCEALLEVEHGRHAVEA